MTPSLPYLPRSVKESVAALVLGHGEGWALLRVSTEWRDAVLRAARGLRLSTGACAAIDGDARAVRRLAAVAHRAALLDKPHLDVALGALGTPLLAPWGVCRPTHPYLHPDPDQDAAEAAAARADRACSQVLRALSDATVARVRKLVTRTLPPRRALPELRVLHLQLDWTEDLARVDLAASCPRLEVLHVHHGNAALAMERDARPTRHSDALRAQLRALAHLRDLDLPVCLAPAAIGLSLKV